MTIDSISSRPAVLARPREGRWLGGVCAAIAKACGLDAAWLRLAFVAAALLAGLGAIAYVACWLIMPGEGDDAADATTPRGIVVLAQACGAFAGLGVLVAVAAAATVFGFGWAVLVCAAAVLLAAMYLWPRLRPAWALLPIAALVLPSVAVATAGLRLSTQAGPAVVAPRALSAASYDSGLGTLLIDLRHTALPSSGAELRIHAGVRRTIVALPQNECVHVAVHYTVKPFLGRLAALLDGREDRPFSALVVFGRQSSEGSDLAGNPSPVPGPTLNIDVSSMGGSLYVRDYPDSVNPNAEPDWPGYRVTLEPRPSTAHMSRRLASTLIRAWRVRYRDELQSKHLVDAELPGPCGISR